MAVPGVLEVIGALEGLACLLLAAILFLRGGGRPGPLVLGLNFVAFAAILFLLSIPQMFVDAAPAWAEYGAYIARIVLWTSLLAFAVAYPHWKLTAARVWLLALVVAPGALLLVTAAVNPPLFMRPDGGPTALLKALTLGLRDAALVASLWVFGRHWFRATGSLRAQYAVVLVPYLLYGLNDGLGALLPSLFPAVGAAEPNPFLVLLSSLAVLSVLAIAGFAVRRMMTERSNGEERFLLVWVVAATVLSFVQFLAPQLGKETLFLHFLVDGFATFVLFYGVARYHVLDIDLKVKIGIKSGVLGGVAVGIVFVVEQAISQFIGQIFGLAVGALVAAAGILLLTPVKNFAEKLSDRAVPQVAAAGSADAYLSYRRLAIYRSALEGLLRDGVRDLDKAHSLKALRRQLHITAAEHAMLEAEVRGELLRGDTAAGAVPT